MNTKFLTAALLAAVCLQAGAQTFTEWKDPRVNSTGRAPMHSSYFAYESPEAAMEDRAELSENYLNLNGSWKFAWVKDADQRPTDFFRSDYDDTQDTPGAISSRTIPPTCPSRTTMWAATAGCWKSPPTGRERISSHISGR